jgi:hypothetical protein
VSMFHAELSENCGDRGFLTETDFGFFAVDFNAEQLMYRADVRDLVFLRDSL